MLSEIRSDILHAPPVPPSQLASWLTPEIDAAFTQALSKDPAERPEKLGEWAENLARCLESLPSPREGWPDMALAIDSGSTLTASEVATTQSQAPLG